MFTLIHTLSDQHTCQYLLQSSAGEARRCILLSQRESVFLTLQPVLLAPEYHILVITHGDTDSENFKKDTQKPLSMESRLVTTSVN